MDTHPFEKAPSVVSDLQAQSATPSVQKKIGYIPTFSCFQRTLHHTVVHENDDNDYSDTTTFTELRKTYNESLGRFGKWRIILSLRSLKKICKISVFSTLFAIY